MPRLNYLGPEPSEDNQVLSRAHATSLITSGPTSRQAATTAVEDSAALLASKDYIDLADAKYATVEYMNAGDALNVAASSVGAPGGVAGLTGGKIPLQQLPVLGAGYMKGPFGPTSITPVASAGQTPVKLAEFTIGNQSVAFTPLAYATVLVDSKPGGRPVVELKMSNGAAVYANQTLIASGSGMPIYNGSQVIAVTPTAAAGTANNITWAANTNIVATLWVRSLTTTTVSASGSSVLSAALFLARMVL